MHRLLTAFVVIKDVAFIGSALIPAVKVHGPGMMLASSSLPRMKLLLAACASLWIANLLHLVCSSALTHELYLIRMHSLMLIC